MNRLFGDDDEFHRGFETGVLWQKLHENLDRLTWATRPADVKMFTRMGQAVGYRVSQVQGASGRLTLTFTSTIGG